MKEYNKQLPLLLTALLIGIAAAVSNDFTLSILQQNEFSGGYNYRFTVLLSLPILALATWADNTNYRNFFLGSATVTVLSLSTVLFSESSIFHFPALIGLEFAFIAFGTIAMNKFFYNEKPATQIWAYAIFWMAQSWNNIFKFIQPKSRIDTETVETGLTITEKGWIVCAILTICGLAVWFLKKEPSLSTPDKKDYRTLNGGLFYPLLLALFIYWFVNPNFYRYLAEDNTQFILKNYRLFWLIGVLIGVLLCLKFDRFVVFAVSSITALLLYFVLGLFKTGTSTPYLGFIGLMSACISTSSIVLWIIEALPYRALAITTALLHFMVVFTRGITEALSLGRLLSEISIYPFILSSLYIGAIVIFALNRRKLNRLRIFEEGLWVSTAENTDNVPKKVLIPNLASGSKRFIAAFLDMLVVSIFAFILQLTLGGNAISLILILAAQFFYYIGMENTGGTIGKRIMGLALVDHAGFQPSSVQVFHRMLARLMPLGSLTVLLGGEALHDNWSNTYVVYENQLFIEVEENEKNSIGKIE